MTHIYMTYDNGSLFVEAFAFIILQSMAQLYKARFFRIHFFYSRFTALIEMYHLCYCVLRIPI